MAITQEPTAARLERWEKKLRSITTQSLTTDFVRPADGTKIVEAVHSVTLPEATRTALLQLSVLNSGSNNVSPFTVLLAAFAVLAARLTGDEDISIGTSGDNADPFVLRLPIDAKTPFADLLASVGKVPMPQSPAKAHADNAVAGSRGYCGRCSFPRPDQTPTVQVQGREAPSSF